MGKESADELDSSVPEKLRGLVAPHIESFDYLIERGLEQGVLGLEPVEIADPSRSLRARVWLERAVVMRPLSSDGRQRPIYPTECREGRKTYGGELRADFVVELDGGMSYRIHQSFGRLPIMVKSGLCHLRNMSRKQLVQHKEEALEMGGYFICNGIERIIRLLIVPRRNYVTAVKRQSFARKGVGYSTSATMIRCSRHDQSSASVRVIHLVSGAATLSFTMRKSEYFVPVGIILKALVDVSDFELFQLLTATAPEGSRESPAGSIGAALGTNYVRDRALLIMEQPRKKGLFTRAQCLAYLGEAFRPMMGVPARKSNAFIGRKVLNDFIFVHLDRTHDKFNLLIFMLHKLWAAVDGNATYDNVDTLEHHEALLPGHLLLMFLKERFQQCLLKLKVQCEKELKEKPGLLDMRDQTMMKRVVAKVPLNVGQRVEFLLNTGNLVSESGLDLQQASGYTIVAEKLNFLRYLSHFRSIHRGAFFAELRTTTVRKLLPESWGFLCPVHTPDGAPCGLLMHLTAPCVATSDLRPDGAPKEPFHIMRGVTAALLPFGFQMTSTDTAPRAPPSYLAVLLDGCVIGSLPADQASTAVAHLRRLKVLGTPEVPQDLEVAHIPFSQLGPFPGLFLFSTPGRLMRPVRQLGATSEANTLELIGPLEQGYMEIRCPDSGDGGRQVDEGAGVAPPTHEETHPIAMLSVVANLTPWSDYNQSPRNMYQCQMGKQTMGVPMQAMAYRSDNKFYKLQSPQTPIARTGAYADYCMDDFPSGTNAVVAVLAYTGYDMEDAMIINKSSMERGFAHGQMYKTEVVDLTDLHKKGEGLVHAFRRRKGGPFQEKLAAFVDTDGLPHIGQTLKSDEPYCSVLNDVSGKEKLSKLKGTESAIVDSVTLIGTGNDPLQKASIRLRYNRNPVIGDKFSSRHGQKGVLSQLWPDENMPFSASSGMRPDIIINPHAFPSRMTIGMLVESMAGKAGALHGYFANATPFRSSMNNEAPLIFPSAGSASPPPTDTLDEDDLAARTAKASLPADGAARPRNLPSPKATQGKKAGSAFQGGPGGGDSTVIDEFGKELVKRGYGYYGTETMYSGIYGTELTCDIFMGVVYYQRLRHMVLDKFQVRSTGPVNALTQQPVKGRKFGGGIRFGEMERDALLSHGAAFLLHDRLHSCSDYHVTDVCQDCGSLLAPAVVPNVGDTTASLGLTMGVSAGSVRKRIVTCRVCGHGNGVTRVAMPFVFKYLAAELSAMNVKLTLTIGDA